MDTSGIHPTLWAGMMLVISLLIIPLLWTVWGIESLNQCYIVDGNNVLHLGE